MPAAPRVVSLHLGGGTPTYLRPEELAALCREVEGAFPLAGAREVSVEIDPRVTTAEHLEVLRAAGASRVSLGVQDASEEVQSAIGRHQTWEETAGCHALCRRLGFESVNIDLVYGLPLQSTARFAHTLDAVLGLRPDRFAVFGYAHVPWIRSNQKAIDPAALPGADERLDLFLMAHEKLTAAGYVHVGLDHFALEGDPLAGAQAEGSLGRNFMGYTPFRGSQVLGFGVSSIGDVGAGYFQNEKKLSRYFARLERGELPVERGWVSSPDDRLRRFVIEEILSNQRLDGADFERRSGLPFAAYFDVEGKRLEELEDDGLIERRDGVLHVTSIGRLFLRNIAMVFDAYLESRPAGSPGRPLYSRTV
jgi:oxygen-independent coproporphyrinogen-3 oxidase